MFATAEATTRTRIKFLNSANPWILGGLGDWPVDRGIPDLA